MYACPGMHRHFFRDKCKKGRRLRVEQSASGVRTSRKYERISQLILKWVCDGGNVPLAHNQMEAPPQSVQYNRLCDVPRSVFIMCDQSIKFAFNINFRLNFVYAYKFSYPCPKPHNNTMPINTKYLFPFALFSDSLPLAQHQLRNNTKKFAVCACLPVLPGFLKSNSLVVCALRTTKSWWIFRACHTSINYNKYRGANQVI